MPSSSICTVAIGLAGTPPTTVYGGDVAADHRAGRHDGVVADPHAHVDDGAGPDEHAVADVHRCPLDGREGPPGHAPPRRTSACRSARPRDVAAAPTRPPEPSITVKAPIQVPSPITGSPMTHACGLYGLAGSAVSSCTRVRAGRDQVIRSRSRPVPSCRWPGRSSAPSPGPRGAGDVGGPAGHEDVAGVELRLHVDAHGRDQRRASSATVVSMPVPMLMGTLAFAGRRPAP